MHWKRTVVFTLFSLVLAATTALALPKPGTTVPNATVETLDGKVLDTRNIDQRITLIFFEDKDVTQQNKILKDALSQQVKKKTRKVNADVYAVADVSAWNFWPAKGFVRNAIKSEEKKAGHPIYCDWSGAFGKALGTVKDKSNVILIGPDRKVMLVHAGPVPPAMRERILQETTR